MVGKTFRHRWVRVIETLHVIEHNSFKYRSYPTRANAVDAVSKFNKRPGPFDRAYFLDRDNSENVIFS